HPDNVVRPHETVQDVRELVIDAQIAIHVAVRKLNEIEPIVQDRPQHPVGETVVVFLEIRAVQIRSNVSHAAAFDGMNVFVAALSKLTAPAEPDAAVALDERAHHHLETAGPRLAFAGQADTVGHDNHPAWYLTAAFRDPCVADGICSIAVEVSGKLFQ